MGYISNKPHVIVGIGEILWDMLPQAKRLGGAPANFASHAAAIGARAGIVSAVGQDPLGLDIRKQLTEKQIDTQYLCTSELPTGQVDVSLDSNGHPQYVIHENVAWDHLSLSSQTLEMAQTCDAVCFGSLAQRNPESQQSIYQFLSNTRNECLRVFDINLRQHYFSRDIIERSLLAASILKFNDDEFEVLKNLFRLPEAVEPALRTLLDRFSLQCAAFTRGAAGSIMMDADTVSYNQAAPVTVRDTIGAGDAFTAIMVMGKLNGWTLTKTHKLAGKVAAYVCSQAGATPSLPAALIAELKRKCPNSKISGIDPVTETSPKTSAKHGEHIYREF